jgi:hypothetical protein
VRLLFNASCDWWTNSVGQSSLSICAPKFIYIREIVFAHQRSVGLHSSFLTLRVWSVRFQCISCLRFEVWDSCALVVLPVQYMSRRTFVSLFKVQYEVKSSSWEDHRFLSLTSYVIRLESHCLHKTQLSWNDRSMTVRQCCLTAKTDRLIIGDGDIWRATFFVWVTCM